MTDASPRHELPEDAATHAVSPAPTVAALTLGTIARAAGAQMLAMKNQSLAIGRKADTSPVCAADLAAERIILSGLAHHFPAVAVVSEESAAPCADDHFFLVDPLDGTKDFLAGRADFAVAIAEIKGGRPIRAALCAPAQGLLFLADGAAFCCDLKILDGDAVLAPANFHPIGTRAMAALPVALTSEAAPDAESARLTARLGPTERRTAGACIKFTLLAQGLADIYLRAAPLAPWDVAAGDGLLCAAGGAVVGLDGARLTYTGAACQRPMPPFLAVGDTRALPRLLKALQTG